MRLGAVHQGAPAQVTSSSDFLCRQERLAHPFPAKSFSLQLRPTAGEPACSSQVARRRDRHQKWRHRQTG